MWMNGLDSSACASDPPAVSSQVKKNIDVHRAESQANRSFLFKDAVNTF